MRGKAKKNVFVLFVSVLLAVCVLGACGSKSMSKEEYIEEVIDKLNVVSEGFFNAMTEWAANAATMDTETAKAGVEEMREITKGFSEVASIKNPPKEYAVSHKKLVEGLDRLGEALDKYFDSLITGLDGAPLSAEETLAVQTEVMDSIADITAILEEME